MSLAKVVAMVAGMASIMLMAVNLYDILHRGEFTQLDRHCLMVITFLVAGLLSVKNG